MLLAIICFWRSLVKKERSDSDDIGRFRTHAELMQIVSARLDKPKIYFEAPPSVWTPAGASRFTVWFNGVAAGGREKRFRRLQSIHPFGDGNGFI